MKGSTLTNGVDARAAAATSRCQYAEALSTLETFPSDRLPIDAVPAKAASLLGLGRTQEASALISRARESPAMAADLAEVFLDGNAPEYALKTVDAVLTGGHRVPARIYYLKGRALQATADRLGAMNSFREALARDPKSVDTLVAMAAGAGHESRSTHLSQRHQYQAVDQNLGGAHRVRRRTVRERRLREHRGVLSGVSGLGNVGAGRHSRHRHADDVQARAHRRGARAVR